jgi:hypothetical protein
MIVQELISANKRLRNSSDMSTLAYVRRQNWRALQFSWMIAFEKGTNACDRVSAKAKILYGSTKQVKRTALFGVL